MTLKFDGYNPGVRGFQDRSAQKVDPRHKLADSLRGKIKPDTVAVSLTREELKEVIEALES